MARDPELGFVGDVESVNPAILHRLLAEDLIPVVSTIGGSADGQAYNINADTVAGALAAALARREGHLPHRRPRPAATTSTIPTP